MSCHWLLHPPLHQGCMIVVVRILTEITTASCSTVVLHMIQPLKPFLRPCRCVRCSLPAPGEGRLPGRCAAGHPRVGTHCRCGLPAGSLMTCSLGNHRMLLFVLLWDGSVGW
jgi:hypothetical protein